MGAALAMVLAGCSSPEKQIRANYAEMDQALIAEDAEKALSFLAPDCVSTNAKGKRVSLEEYRGGLQTIFTVADSLTSKTVVSSVTMKGAGATVELESALIAKTKVGTLVATSKSRDYWEKVGEVWKIKQSRTLRESITMNGQPIPGQ
jgi:ketosteroid isomerase-like protein